MGRYRLDLAYDGGGFEGWQVQPGKRTVQGVLEERIRRLGEDARVMGAGRTDTGVHALGQAAHVDLRRDWPPEDLVRILGRSVPPDLAVLDARPVENAFHARHGAESRTYHYALGLEHNAFFRDRRWTVRRLPRPDRAMEELESLVGERDFAAFAKSGSGTAHTRTRVIEAAWIPCAEGAVVAVTAHRFLYGMMRAIVGALVRGFEQNASPGHLLRVLETGDREAAGKAAPAQGLYLTSVKYPGDPAPVLEPLNAVIRIAGLTRSPDPNREAL